MDRSGHGAAFHTVITAHQVVQQALREGIGLAEVRALTGFDPDELTEFSRRIPAERLFAVWEAVMRRIADPGFPVRVARSAVGAERSAVYYLAVASANVREAVVQAVANVTAWTTAYRLAAIDWHGGLSLVLDGLDAARLGARCEAEFQYADILAGLRAVLGENFVPPRVAFTHAAPRDSTAHRDHFGGGLRFRAPHTELVLSKDILDRALHTARPGLASVLAGHVASLRAAESPPASYGLRLREWLLASFLRGERPSVTAAAMALTVSERTLHRRLAAEGLTYRAVCETTRRQLAVDLVRGSPRPFKEIASSIGFADARSFYRAYLRWTGTTPGNDRLAAT